MTRHYLQLWALVCLVALLLFLAPAHASGKPLAIFLAPAAQTITEGQTATLTLSKSGGGRPSTVKWSTSDGSASGSIVGSGTISVPTVDDVIVNGTRTITVTATASTGASAKAAITVLDNDVPVPAPPPPPVTCPDGSVLPAGSTCPVTPPPAPVPSGQWVTGPLTVGGYACNAIQAGHDNVPPCGGGIVMRITGQAMSADAVPLPLYSAVFYSDASGQFPLNDIYDVNFVGWWAPTDLQGLAPAP